MSSARQPPRPSCARAAIHATPRRWYGRSVAARPAGSGTSVSWSSAARPSASDATGPTTVAETISPSTSIEPLMAAPRASPPCTLGVRRSFATSSASTITHRPRSRTSGRFASANTASSSAVRSCPSTDSAHRNVRRDSSVNPAAVTAPGWGVPITARSCGRVASSAGTSTSTPTEPNRVPASPRRSITSVSLSARALGRASSSRRVSAGQARPPRRSARSRSVSARSPKRAATAAGADQTSAASTVRLGSKALVSCTTAVNEPSGPSGNSRRRPARTRASGATVRSASHESRVRTSWGSASV